MAVGLLVAGGVAVAVAAGRSSSDPAELRLAAERSADNPLRATVTARTSDPTTVAVELRGPDGEGFRIVPPAEAQTEHAVPLLGLRADTTYEATVTVRTDEDETTTDAVTLQTGSLPADFPPVEIDLAPGGGQPLTLFDAGHMAPTGEEVERDLGYLIVVDGAGEVVWYEAMEQPIEDARRTVRGTFLFVYDETGAREIAPTGELLREWSGTTALDDVPEDGFGRRIVSDDVVRVETDQMHHEIVELANGNLLTLSREVRTVSYPEPICEHTEDDPFDGTYRVGGDVIVEFVPDTGEIVYEVSLFDLVDPLDYLERTEPGEFCSPYLDRRYPAEAPVRDWSHANAVVLDEARNALWVSGRHTDTLLAVRYADDEDGPAGELLWELGDGGDFALVGDGEWFRHQHAPEVGDDGTILLYDNGNWRPGTALDDPARYPYSRAVRYAVDEAARTAEQVDEHRFPSEDGVYAPYVGDADLTDAGTVLIAHGGLVDPLSHSPGEPGLVLWARLVEVDDRTGELRFDLRVRDPEGVDGWRIYRAERIASLYPPDHTVEPLGGR